MKDNFSAASDKYAQFRPSYPDALFDYLLSLVPTKDHAWDCGTGNGQIAIKLARYFRHIEATDISAKQLENAQTAGNIEYSVQPAERTNFPENHFDLITVAQAIHWFDFNKFYSEVDRTIRKDGILAVIGYGLLTIDEKINSVINSFYRDIIGPYWDAERKYVDENYWTIPFPYEDIKAPQFRNEFEWTFDHLIGYIETWSAVRHYEKMNGNNPVGKIKNDLKKAWGESETKAGYFPILLRVARPKP